MKVLFIGGSGTISTAVSQRAIETGIELYVMNRGKNNKVLPKGVNILKADINNADEVREVLSDHFFDAIVQWIAFTPKDVKRDMNLFKGKTKQYVFISTASAYQKPLPKIPITEDVPLGNPYWEYSQNKQKAEEYLLLQNEEDFNVTIIRPSHTYDDTKIVAQIKNASTYTLLHRILIGKSLVIPNMGKTRWTLTHSRDFAKGFVDILGNEAAYNEVFHLTSEKVYTWNEIMQALFEALGKPVKIHHMPIDYILKHFPELKGELLGDKLADAVFDNSKIKKIAPHYSSSIEYPDVVKKAVKFHLSERGSQAIDEDFMKRYDTMVDEYIKYING